MIKRILKKGYYLTNEILNILLLNNLFFKYTFIKQLRNELAHCNTILEVGAGTSSYLSKTSIKFHITAIDRYLKSLLIAKQKKVYNNFVVADVLSIDNIFKENSFDAIVAFDLIEHLAKDKGYELVEKMKRITRKKIVIYTPNGFLQQPPTPDNPFQEHKSGWDYYEMRKMGFKVFGINGYKELTGLYAIPKIKPVALGNLIRNISSVFLKILNKTDRSFAILCFLNKSSI